MLKRPKLLYCPLIEIKDQPVYGVLRFNVKIHRSNYDSSSTLGNVVCKPSEKRQSVLGISIQFQH